MTRATTNQNKIIILAPIAVLHLETNEGLSQAIINIERHNLGLDYLRQYKQSILDIGPSEILDAAGHWMHPTNVALSIAGPTYYKES